MSTESLSNEMTDLINTIYAMVELLEQEPPSDAIGRARVHLLEAVGRIEGAQDNLDLL